MAALVVAMCVSRVSNGIRHVMHRGMHHLLDLIGTAPGSWASADIAIRWTWDVAIDTFYKHRWHQRFDYKLYINYITSMSDGKHLWILVGIVVAYWGDGAQRCFRWRLPKGFLVFLRPQTLQACFLHPLLWRRLKINKTKQHVELNRKAKANRRNNWNLEDS
jgi:hypothetical protein